MGWFFILFKIFILLVFGILKKYFYLFWGLVYFYFFKFLRYIIKLLICIFFDFLIKVIRVIYFFSEFLLIVI